MSEVANIGAQLGLPIDQMPQKPNAATRESGAMKASILQDVEKRNSLEFETIIGVVHEIAEKLDLEVSNISMLYGLIRLYATNVDS